MFEDWLRDLWPEIATTDISSLKETLKPILPKDHEIGPASERLQQAYQLQKMYEKKKQLAVSKGIPSEVGMLQNRLLVLNSIIYYWCREEYPYINMPALSEIHVRTGQKLVWTELRELVEDAEQKQTSITVLKDQKSLVVEIHQRTMDAAGTGKKVLH